MLALQLYVSAWRHGLRVAASFAVLFIVLALFAGVLAAVPLVLAAVAAPAWPDMVLPALLVLGGAVIVPLALGLATQPDTFAPAAELGPHLEREATNAVPQRD